MVTSSKGFKSIRPRAPVTGVVDAVERETARPHVGVAKVTVDVLQLVSSRGPRPRRALLRPALRRYAGEVREVVVVRVVEAPPPKLLQFETSDS